MGLLNHGRGLEMHKFRPYMGLWALVIILEVAAVVQLLPPKFKGWVPVTVQPGQTLWALGQTYCPNTDPRDVFQAIETRNHISGHIQPGEVVLVPTQSVSWWTR